MRRKSVNPYTEDWPYVAQAVKDAAGWTCIRCGHPHEPAAGYTLTVHHADLNPQNNHWTNTWSLCQRCHLSVQGRVDLNRPWVFEHSEWAKPYMAGFYAMKYLGLDLTRPEVEARIDELLLLEQHAVLPWTKGT